MMTVPPRIRLWIAGLLACCAIGLGVMSWLTGYAGFSGTRKAGSRSVQAGTDLVLREVEGVASKFKVPRNAMRVLVPKKGETGAAEVRLRVGPEFSSYEFHCALAAALAELDVAVTGTESIRTRNTVLQIARDSVTIVRVDLDMRTLPQQPRKESRH